MMTVFPRPLARTCFFVLVGIVAIYCLKDRVYELLTALTENQYFINGEPTEQSEETAFFPFKRSPNQRNVTKRELVLLQMLFRHGHRAPFMTYPTDPNNESFWMEGLGTLTRLGRLQHYQLGLHLQNKYKDFITTNPKEVELVSAESSRTQHGAYSFLAGLYSPRDEYTFTKDLRWQPIISKNSNKYKNILTRGPCYKAEKEYHLLRSSKMANDTRDRFQDLYHFLSIKSGRVIDDWHLANDLGKTFACEKKYNLTIPDWAYMCWDDLQIQTALNYYFHYGTKEILRYRIGPLVGFMVDRMKARAYDSNSEKKVFIFSAHGSYIAQTLMVLNRYNWREPPPASTLVAELWKENDQDYSVRWLYFNSTSPEFLVDPPHVLTFDECGGEYCPLGDFVEKTKLFIPDDYDRECNDTTYAFKPLDLICDPIVDSSSCSIDSNVTHIIFALLALLTYFKIIYKI